MSNSDLERFDNWISECQDGKLSFIALHLIRETYGARSFELIISSHIPEATKSLAISYLVNMNSKRFLPIIISWLEKDAVKAGCAHTVLCMLSDLGDCIIVCKKLLKKLRTIKDLIIYARIVSVLIEFTKIIDLWDMISSSLIKLKTSASPDLAIVLIALEGQLFKNDPYKPVPFSPFTIEHPLRKIKINVSSPPGPRELTIHYLCHFKPGNKAELVKLFSIPTPYYQNDIDVAIYEDLGFSFIRLFLLIRMPEICDSIFHAAIQHDITSEERSLLVRRGIELGGYLSVENIEKLFSYHSNNELSDEAVATIFCNTDILKILQTRNYLAALIRLFSIESPFSISQRLSSKILSIPSESFLTHLYQNSYVSDKSEIASVLTSKKHKDFTEALVIYILSQMSELGMSDVLQRRQIYARFFNPQGLSHHILKLKNGRSIYRRIYERRPDLKGEILNLFLRVPEIPNSFFLEEFRKILSNGEELNSESCLDFILYVLHYRSKQFSWFQRFFFKSSIRRRLSFVKNPSLKMEFEKVLI